MEDIIKIKFVINNKIYEKEFNTNNLITFEKAYLDMMLSLPFKDEEEDK